MLPIKLCKRSTSSIERDNILSEFSLLRSRLSRVSNDSRMLAKGDFNSCVIERIKLFCWCVKAISSRKDLRIFQKPIEANESFGSSASQESLTRINTNWIIDSTDSLIEWSFVVTKPITIE